MILAPMTPNDPKNIKVHIHLEVETDGDTPAEELSWLLNLIRYEMTVRPNWTGKIRRVGFDRPHPPL